MLTLSYQFERNTEEQLNKMRLTEQINFDLPDYNQDNLFGQDDHTVQLD